MLKISDPVELSDKEVLRLIAEKISVSYGDTRIYGEDVAKAVVSGKKVFVQELPNMVFYRIK
jgi:fructose-1,6-bisphosphatase/inositol monophosphatase family enzyme